MCTIGINRQTKRLAFRWQLCRAGLVLQGLEWSSICGLEAGSVPTVPWQGNVQPSQPWQLGYSQGVMENWGAAVSCWSLGSSEEEEGETRWVRNTMFYIILVLQGHVICCVSKNKPGLVMRASCLCWPAVIKFILWQVCLEEGASTRFKNFCTL